MEQRRLRLGDILDDYCPRERRLTNHAVVAMIEEDVKQTRCTTCDAEHAYKGGKLPRKRKKDTASALYKEVLAGHLASDATPIAPELEDDARLPAAAPAANAIAPADEPVTASAPAADPPDGDDLEERHDAETDVEPAPQVEEGPVHRPLIRAQLPRIEGQKEERRLPEFTIRQRAGGNGHFRGGAKPHRPGGHGGNGAGAGNRTHGGPRFAGPRPAGAGGRGQAARGAGAGFRSGQQPRPGGGRKRSR
jgi:hypothetical protein